jgi:outer membrane receptor protein involved in Fe transport
MEDSINLYSASPPLKSYRNAAADLKAGVEYRKWRIYAGVANLFDKSYCTHLSYLRDPLGAGVKVPENGRNLYITMVFEI